MTDWKKIKAEYENTDATMKDLANEHGINVNTLRTHKSRNKWQRKVTSEHFHKNVSSKDEMKRNEMKRKNISTLQSVDEVNQSGLNDKQQMFCMLYLRYYNAAKAYKLAYNCSYATAATNGPALLRNAHVNSLMHKLREKQSADLFLNANDILREYAKQAFADFGDYVEFGHKKDEDPDTGQPFQRSYLYFKNKDDVDTSLISEAHIGQNGAVIKLNDKQKAMSELLKRLPEPTNTSKQDNSFVKALQNSLYGKDKNKDNDSNENEEN